MTQMTSAPSLRLPRMTPFWPIKAWLTHPRAPHGQPPPAPDATSPRATAARGLVLVGVLVCAALVWSGERWDRAIAQEVVLAVIADYGVPDAPEAEVADLVRSWNPDVVITAGDNCYDPGDYLSNVDPYYGDFVAAGQFFPAIGDHDRHDCGGLEAYAAYFNVPRYYDVVSGPVHVFILNSEPDEPDGVTSDSPQAEWLRTALEASTAPWKIVVAHHPPYSSGIEHGSHPYMQWPFQAWGASVVISGDDHLYERLIVDDLPYFVVGLGGAVIHDFGPPIEGSVVRYNDEYGAMLIEADAAAMTLSFYTRVGELIDAYTLGAGSPAGVSLVPEQAAGPAVNDGAPRGGDRLRGRHARHGLEGVAVTAGVYREQAGCERRAS
jgi:tartrate-resistant acid phosphatase type 5